MRVRDCDLGNSAQLGDAGDRRIVHERHAIPQDIPFVRANQKSTLANPKPWLGVDRVEIGFFLLDGILVRRAEIHKRRPLLAIGIDVLSLVLANRAMRGGF